MICPKCGAEANDGDNFCEECGASLKKTGNLNNSPQDFEKTPGSDILSIDPNLAVVSNIGMKHPKNEDTGTAMRCENGSVILIVSDGVSSAVNAVSASLLAVNKVKDILSGSQVNDEALLKSAINEANEVILGLPYETREDGIYGPEATIAAAIVSGDEAIVGWAGDSRAYVISEICQKPLTVDDSWIELIVASGQMTREEAMMDRRAHYVTQVLGMHDEPLDIHTIRYKLEKGEIMLLCSDGLWNYLLGDDGLQKAVLSFGIEKDAAEICEHLVGIANSAGGHDNITVAIYKNV